MSPTFFISSSNNLSFENRSLIDKKCTMRCLIIFLIILSCNCPNCNNNRVNYYCIVLIKKNLEILLQHFGIFFKSSVYSFLSLLWFLARCSHSFYYALHSIHLFLKKPFSLGLIKPHWVYQTVLLHLNSECDYTYVSATHAYLNLSFQV